MFPSIQTHLLLIMLFDDWAKYTDLVRTFFRSELKTIENVGCNIKRRQYIVNIHKNNYGKNTLETRIPTLLNTLPDFLHKKA